MAEEEEPSPAKSKDNKGTQVAKAKVGMEEGSPLSPLVCSSLLVLAAITRTHTHTHTHNTLCTHTLSHTSLHTLSLFLSLSLSTHTQHTHKHAHTISLSIALSSLYVLAQPLSHSLSLSHTHTPCLYLSCSYSCLPLCCMPLLFQLPYCDRASIPVSLFLLHGRINRPLPCVGPVRSLTSVAVEEYRQQVRSKLAKLRGQLDEVEGSAKNKLGLLALLQLEYVRISHGISRRTRDDIAEELSLPVHILDPSRTVYFHNESLEAARRSIEKAKSSICGKCGQSLRFTRSSQCFYCRKRLCTSHAHPNQVKILEFRWNTPHTVCVDCHDSVRLQRQLLRRICDRVSDCPDAVDDWGTASVSSLMESLQSAKFADNAEPLCTQPTGVRSIAAFPSAGLLFSVVCSRLSHATERSLAAIPPPLPCYTIRIHHASHAHTLSRKP